MCIKYCLHVQLLQELTKHHISAFNYAVDEGLKYAVEVTIGTSITVN